MSEAFALAAAIIVSLGGGGLLVLSLSSWLGKVWAERILATEKKRAEEAVAQFQAHLDRETGEKLASLERTLDLQKERLLSAHIDKLAIYRSLTDTVAELVADWTEIVRQQKVGQEAQTAVLLFERKRLRIYGYLGMLAPQSVMVAHDALMDYLLGAMEGSRTYDFATMRTLAIAMLNEIRKDIGIDSSPIHYTGKR